MAAGAVLIAVAAMVEVNVIWPRVTIRWQAGLGPENREALERRYDLRAPESLGAATWRYELRNASRENVRALVSEPAVEDTGYIDRGTLAVDPRRVRVGRRSLEQVVASLFGDSVGTMRQLLQVQSLLALLAAGALLLAAKATDVRRRRNLAIASLIAFVVVAWAYPISGSLVRMGDANQFAQSRTNFETVAAVSRIRFEAHLSYAVLGQIYQRLPATEDAPRHAQMSLARAAALWFVVWALVLAALQSWSVVVLRYLSLAVLAPSALMYFGWREFGYLSLNVAAFPLVLLGLRGGSGRLETGSVLTGLGAALHGFGLVAFVGAVGAAWAASGSWLERLDRSMRVLAWGTAAYLGWIALYVIAFRFPITPGHAQGIPWRPWLEDTVGEGRLNVAIFSAAGIVDVVTSAWVVGVPLLFVAAPLWRRYGEDVRVALVYSIPSVVFLVCFWPIQGLGEEMDLIVAAFPALYALAWICAHDASRTKVAAGLLASAHLAFWIVLLDGRFAGRLVDIAG